MRLEEFEKSGRGERVRYVAPIRDTSGAEDYELILVGPEALFEQGFMEADLEAVVDTAVPFEQSEEALREIKELELKTYSELAALERPDKLFKEPPPDPSVENSVFASLRRLHGEGTLWSFTVRGLGPLPQGVNLFFLYPPVCSCSATVVPASGDQDLFLSRQFIFGASVLRAVSLNGGTLVDFVADSNPPLTPCNLLTHFIDLLRINWFSQGTAATLTISGFS
jgi:hypothetical protein